MRKFIQRAKVVSTNILTFLVAAQTVLSVAVVQFEGIPAVARYGALALTGLALVISFIRRVTPVLDEAYRGLLPPDDETVLRSAGFDPEETELVDYDLTGVYVTTTPKVEHTPRAEEIGAEIGGYV